MIVNTVTIKNFLAISEAQVTLGARGLLLVQGENRDDTSAISNGAGKSSIGDALFWCLYGETARGVTGDSVVNRKNKKDCAVWVRLTDGDDTYLVSRYRKDTKFKNSLRIDKMGVGDISKGTDKETQALLVQILGASIDVFKAAVYSGQEQMPDLPGMTDKELKLLVEEAAGIDILQDAYALARTEALVVKEGILKATALRTAASDRMDRAKIAESAANATHAAWEGEREGRVEAQEIFYATTKKNYSAQLKVIRDYPTTLPILQSQLDALDQDILVVASQKHRHASMVNVCAVKNRALTAATTAHAMNLKALKHAKSHFDGVGSRVGTPCNECGKPYTGDDLATAEALAKAKMLDAARDAQQSKANVEAAQNDANAQQSALEAYELTMTDVSKAVAQKNALMAMQKTLEAEHRALAAAEAQVAEAEQGITRLQAEANPYDVTVASANKELEAASEILKNAKGEVEVAEKAEALAAATVAVLGPAGVRAHILDTVTPYLNERTSRYLGALSDGNINATWSTLTKTAKGDLREKFNIEVVNEQGADSFAGLSGGEKRKVRLSCALALQDLVASRATKPIDLWIGDEIDDALDEGGLERLMGILEDKARERGTVMVISHNALTDWIRESVVVVKEGGVSTVTKA